MTEQTRRTINYTNRPELLDAPGSDYKLPEGMPRAEVNTSIASPSPENEPGAIGSYSLPPGQLQETPESGLRKITESIEWDKKHGSPYGASSQPTQQQQDPWDRNAFEKAFLDSNLEGQNPYTIDPYDAIQKADAQLPELFNYVFDGKVTWADRGNLDKDQAAFWDDIKKEHHAREFNKSKAKAERNINMYKMAMSRFDEERGRALAKEDKLEARQQRQENILESRRIRAEERASNPPKTQVRENAKGKYTIHEWDPDTRSFRDTGKRGKPEGTLYDRMPPNYKYIADEIEAFEKKFNDPLTKMIMQEALKNPKSKDSDQFRAFGISDAQIKKYNENQEYYEKYIKPWKFKEMQKESDDEVDPATQSPPTEGGGGPGIVKSKRDNTINNDEEYDAMRQALAKGLYQEPQKSEAAAMVAEYETRRTPKAFLPPIKPTAPGSKSNMTTPVSAIQLIQNMIKGGASEEEVNRAIKQFKIDFKGYEDLLTALPRPKPSGPNRPFRNY